MAGVSRDNDTAGGDLIPSQGTVFANGELVIVDNDAVAGHGSGKHSAPTIPAGNQSKIYAEGKLIVISGDDATCGHLATGSSDVLVGNLFAIPVNITPEHEAYLREGADTAVTGADVLEYGDGGISNGDGEFLANNTSPITGETGPRTTPENTSSFKRTSNPRLNFLPHTTPTLEPELENKLIRLAKDWGQTLVITSAYRSPAYNGKLRGAAETSFHVGRPFGSGRAMACDIVMSPYSLDDRIVFIEKAINNGLRGIGIYNTFIHVDIGPKRCWASNGTRRSMPERCPWARPILQKYGYSTGPK